MEKEIVKVINREIIKCAKKGELHYYWDISDLDKITVNRVIILLERDGKIVKSKGEKYKIIMW